MTSGTNGQDGMRLSSPNDSVNGLGLPLSGATVLDFWKWAYSLLSNDPTKGEFAEFMAAKLLGISTEPGGRIEGNDWDLKIRGIKIEVKAAAYWQAWKLRNPDGTWRSPDSKKTAPIRFANLWARQAQDSASAPDFKSHIYAFCLQHEKDPSMWDALDLSQWAFFVLPVGRLRELLKNRNESWKGADQSRSFGLSLKALEKECGEGWDAAEFRVKGQRLIDEITI